MKSYYFLTKFIAIALIMAVNSESFSSEFLTEDKIIIENIEFNDIVKNTHLKNSTFFFSIKSDSVDKPSFSPRGGEYKNYRNIKILCDTEDVDIYYTLDGTEPTQSSIYYPVGSQIYLSDSTIIKARAYKSGLLPSSIATAEYYFINEISGKAYLEGMPGGYYEGLDIEFSGEGFEEVVEVNSFGGFKVYVPDNWSGTATPIICENSGVNFTPTHFEFFNVSDEIEDQDFSAVADQLYTITGTITDSITGEPIANQEIRFDIETSDGGKPYNMNVNTNENGEYTIVQFPCWSVTLNPGLENYYITPFTKQYTQWDQDYANQDYKAYFYDFPLPEGWEYSNSDKVHTISISSSADPNLCGEALNIGDLIGLFYIDDNGDLACGGWARWQDETNIALVAFGDDNYSPEKDGFANFEPFNWLVYSYSTGQIIGDETSTWSLEYEPGWSNPYNFALGGLSIVTEMSGLNANNIIIPVGWSGISSYAETTAWPPLIANVLAPISNELILIQDMQKMYYPAQNINTMFLWTDAHGYKIKMSEDAVLPMPGCPPTQVSIDLNTTWNLLPVMSASNVLLTDLFATTMDDLIVVKEIAGSRLFWPEWGIETLQVLEPGKAYYVAVSEDISVLYENLPTYKSEPQSVEVSLNNLTPWNTPVETGSSHTIAFPADVISSIEAGDYIAAFNTGGLCTGMVQCSSTAENLALTVYGEDMLTPENDGMAEGEHIYFKVFKTNQGESMDVYVDFDGSYALSDGTFADNGLSVVSSLKESSSGISEVGKAGFEIFPNPAGSYINIVAGSEGDYQLKIQHMNGQLVMSKVLNGDTRIDVSGLSRGVYFAEISGQQSKTISKLILK